MRIPALSALAALAAPLASQQIPVLRLTKPEARLNHEFSAISGLRELPDGRVLVSDGIDETVLRIDLRTGKVDTLWRSGSGPGEYKSPDLLFEVPGGTMLVDLGNARLSFYDAALKYQESMPIARGEPGLGMTMVMPQVVDAQGRIYTQAIMRDPAGGRADSGAVLRFDRVKGTLDTVAKLKMGEVEISQSGGPNNRSMSMRPVPLSPEDEWGVGPDGRVAIARASNYALEWVGGGKPTVKGPANPFKPVPIRDADKKEYGQDMSNGLSIMVQNDNGRMSVRMGRGGLRGRDRDEQEALQNFKWPDTKPAARAVMVAPDGTAWVERHVAAGTPREYDLFGPDGKLRKQVVLPAGRRLVGFGKGVVYLRETTADELLYLERYRP
jgi:hypothetical protein